MVTGLCHHIKAPCVRAKTRAKARAERSYDCTTAGSEGLGEGLGAAAAAGTRSRPEHIPSGINPHAGAYGAAAKNVYPHFRLLSEINSGCHGNEWMLKLQLVSQTRSF